jgi:hypothetical protein
VNPNRQLAVEGRAVQLFDSKLSVWVFAPLRGLRHFEFAASAGCLSELFARLKSTKIPVGGAVLPGDN